ncbi:amidase [Mesorhizobium sp. M1163]|uniref:amidase n=1 Tax=Mesorhizobium sp. M1163 TaxID=2957065 RepID=UPI00333981DC
MRSISRLPTATEQLALFRRKEASPLDFVKLALEEIENFSALNFIRCPDIPGLMEQAELSERRWLRGEPNGRLDGVLATAKDNCLVKGWTSFWGSLTRSQLASEDSPVVARLRESGALILGITTMPEFGWKGVCDNARDGATLNPWDRTRTPGGSSGGAAVAATLGIPLNVGTDGAGSIRIPASFCGVVGFKPTYGIVPAYPVGSLPNFTHVGPITRSAVDAALMFDVLAQPDPRDWQAISFKLPRRPLPDRPRVAYSRTLGYAKPDLEIIEISDIAIERLKSLGWIIEEVDPGFAEPINIIRTLYFSAFANMVRAVPSTSRDQIDPGLVEEIKAIGLLDADAIISALSQRDALGRHMNAFHRKHDFLLTPTMPIVAFETGTEIPTGRSMKSWFDWNPFTYPFNLTQQPAATIPSGITKDGLPVGLQIVGSRYDDFAVLEACCVATNVVGRDEWAASSSRAT